MRDVFVSIDFETADQQRDSACAIGLCRVEGATITRRETRLIRPPRGMSAQCQAVHGLSWHDVKDAPRFGAVWPELLPLLDGARFLTAHNVPFDRAVLEACCAAARLTPPKLDWVCTLALSRAKWKKPHSNRLPDVCTRLSIPFLNHHEAGADAEACARVLLALDGRTRAPAPAVAPLPCPAPPGWVPSGPCGAVLDRIPAEHRTPAVLALMRDAERLGPALSADLVATVRRERRRKLPGRPRCKCGRQAVQTAPFCAICAAAVSALPEDAPEPYPGYRLLLGCVAEVNKRRQQRFTVDIGSTGRVALLSQHPRSRRKRRRAFSNIAAALTWLSAHPH